MDGKKIGNFIRLKRQELGLTIEQFCAEVGVQRFLLERWENGEAPETQYLIAISKVLQTSVDELLKGLDTPVEEETLEKIEPNSVVVAEAKPQEEKGYYESLNEQIAKTDYSHYESVEPKSENGFSDGERKFGFILCAFMIALIIFINVSNAFTFLSRPRELTVENCKQFLEIRVSAENSVNEGKFEVRLTRKKKSYDVKNLQLTVQIEFSRALNVPYPGGNEIETRQVRFSDDCFTENESQTATVILPSVLYRSGKITVVSASGEM